MIHKFTDMDHISYHYIHTYIYIVHTYIYICNSVYTLFSISPLFTIAFRPRPPAIPAIPRSSAILGVLAAPCIAFHPNATNTRRGGAARRFLGGTAVAFLMSGVMATSRFENGDSAFHGD